MKLIIKDRNKRNKRKRERERERERERRGWEYRCHLYLETGCLNRSLIA